MYMNNKRGLNMETSTMEDESDDSDYGEDMLTMVEEDDLEFLKNAIDSRSYGILKRVKHNSGSEIKTKRKRSNQASDDDDGTMEREYEDQVEAPAKLKDLLPIKTGQGIIRRTVQAQDDSKTETEGEESEEEDEYVFDENPELDEAPKSQAELLGVYGETMQIKKLEIGALCTALLENPEEKIINLKGLLQILDEISGDAAFSVRKIVIVSLLEVFKDILPSYQIKLQATGGVKLKKDTLKLRKYEEMLLLYYKKYLQRLEKFCSMIYKRRTGGAEVTTQRKLGELSVQVLCDLLVVHPYFNFAPNIAQAVVPFLNHAVPSVRQSVSSACKTIFKEDKKEEITLKILRVLNHYVKSHSHNVRPDVLEILLHLRIKDVNLDMEREREIKQKKLMARKQNVLQLSKKERKRKKRLQYLEKEMLETKAEENKQNKQKTLTEIVKIVFGIYFRILKSCNTDGKILGVCLEGLAKYSHCINLDYYMDLLNLLDGLLKREELGHREQLHCIQTVFAILAEQGEALTLDPSRFYSALYKNLLRTSASDVPAILRTLDDLLVKRRKKMTSKRLLGFTKRTATLSLQLPHNGALGCLGVVKSVLQLNKTVDVLLDPDVTIGEGDYQPELDDPEYCNAASTSLYELALLTRHYHPVVAKFAQHIAGDVNLPVHYGKLSPEELYNEFDPSSMAFNPAVPTPKQAKAKAKSRSLQFTDTNFQSYCENVLRCTCLT